MKIQIISYEKNRFSDIPNIVHNTLSSPRSLDEFDLNIIDCTEPGFWFCVEDVSFTSDNDQNLETLQRMIIDTERAVFIMMPQNLCLSEYVGGVKSLDIKAGELRLNVEKLEELVSKKLLSYQAQAYRMKYINATVNYEDMQLSADFSFEEIPIGAQIEKKATRSESAVLISTSPRIFMSTLNINNTDELMCVLKSHGIVTEDEPSEPEWLKALLMFDDKKQGEIISSERAKIQDAQSKINVAELKLNRNAWYKSVLYKADNPLVEVVVAIIQELLEIDLSGFIDVRKEDQRFEIDGITYIVEIKGVNTNVRRDHVSQLDNHVQEFIQESEKSEEKVKGLLIINPMRNKSLSERDEIHADQIRLATRNRALIITTETLLKIFERKLKGQLNKNEIIEKLVADGLLTL